MELAALGSRIKAERKRQGLTLETLAEKLGISRNFLWEIEAGRKAPALSTLYRLGVTLNISIDYLLGTSAERRSLGSVPATERDRALARITQALSRCETAELALVADIVQDFTRYLERRKSEGV